MNFRHSFCAFFVAMPLACSVSMNLGQAAQQTASTAFLHGIDVSINGSKIMHFGLDTGLSVAFSITPENAHRLNLPVTSHRTIHSSDQEKVAGKATDVIRTNSLTVAGYNFDAPEGIVLEDAHRDGTLGIALFRDVLLTLDYPGDRLSIREGELPLQNGRDVIPYTTDPNAPLRPLRISPTVAIQLAGKTFSALLDTGARKLNADVIVPVKTAATLPLGPRESNTTLSDAIGNKFPSYTARLDGDLQLGEVVLHNPTVLVTDWLGFIDLARVSNQLVLTIDQKNRRLRVTMPSGVVSQ